MEPTIYKPSIYKGAGIYNNGAGGGGIIENEFRLFNILGKEYKFLKIKDGVYFPCENLDFYDENFIFGNLQDNTICASYFNNDIAYKERGLYYSNDAIVYIKTLLDNKFKYINASYIQDLYDYIQSKFDFIISDELKTYLAKSNTWNKTPWNNSLDLFELNINPFGSMHYNTGIDDYNVFCFLCGNLKGLVTGSSGNRNEGSFNISDAITIGLNYGYFYNIRFIVDEN